MPRLCHDASRLPLPAGALAVLVLAAAGPVSSGGDGDPFEAFADRWVRTTSGDGEVLSMFRDGALIAFEAQGKSRTLEPGDYGKLLADAHGRMRSFERRREEVEVTPGEDGRGPSISFVVVDRIGDPQGFTIRTETREDFDFAPGDLARAVRYRSEVLKHETLEKPEEWRQYGGPIGLNGFLAESYFYAAPKGMGFWFAGGAVVIAMILWALHSLGIKRRF